MDGVPQLDDPHQNPESLPQAQPLSTEVQQEDLDLDPEGLLQDQYEPIKQLNSDVEISDEDCRDPPSQDQVQAEDPADNPTGQPESSAQNQQIQDSVDRGG